MCLNLCLILCLNEALEAHSFEKCGTFYEGEPHENWKQEISVNFHDLGYPCSRGMILRLKNFLISGAHPHKMCPKSAQLLKICAQLGTKVGTKMGT